MRISLVCLALLVGCDDTDVAPLDGGADGALADIATPHPDVWLPDVTGEDSAPPDGTPPDGPVSDAAQLDGTLADGPVADRPQPDGAWPDGSLPDAADPDVPWLDAARPDGAEVDGPWLDGPLPDAADRDRPWLDGALADFAELDGPAPDGPSLDVPELDGPLPDGPEPDGPRPDMPLPDMPLPDMPLPDMPEPDAGPPPRCADPVACDEAAPDGVRQHHMGELGGCAFALVRTGDSAAARAITDEVAQAAVGYLRFLDIDLNRDGVEGITAGAAARLRNHPHQGLRWNGGDMATTDWYPQGMSGISDAQTAPPDRRWLLVSWYDHRDARPTKGIRISLIDATDLDDVRYRHVLLVVPLRDGGRATFGPVETSPGGSPVHAGGIVWFGNLLYVADTSHGFRVFDLARIIEVEDFDRARIGVSAGRVDAHGYRYIAPQIARYQHAEGACALRFSFAGLDRSEDPPLIVTGEYHRDDSDGRLARWPVGRNGWLLEEEDGRVFAHDAVTGAQTKMQGGVSWAGDYYISSSSQVGNLGRLYRTRPGIESVISAWPYGCEDLYLERTTNRVWTATEHPGAREVVSIVRLPP